MLMPTIFAGHGSPMNAIEDNVFSRSWRDLGRTLPQPKAILCISAHWETRGTMVTAMERPRTIHDFGGFPEALFQVEYPAPGSAWLAHETGTLLPEVKNDTGWGLDHGTWSVLKNMYPRADVPVVQLSLDYDKTPNDHFETGRKLFALREQGVLIIGSGNMVHNLARIAFKSEDFNEPFGLGWAVEANALFKKLIDEERYCDLVAYQSLGPAVRLAAPTPEHFLPLLYVLALKQKGERVRYFNDRLQAGSLSMTSLVVE
jgi:4,5-DOPA dioxygenase extradiol